MSKFKNYSQFNEGIEDIFRSAHAAVEKKDLKPLKPLLGKPKFPTKEEFQQVVDMTGADPDHFYYDKTNMLNPIIYWKGPMFYGFFGGLNLEAIKMMRVDQYFKHKTELFDKMIASKDYEGLFSRMDKKVLIPNFVEMYKEIPDNQKYDIFKDLYVRSEYGFQMFPLEIIKDCFDKRKLSSDWKKRMEKFKKEAKLQNGMLTVYRGENLSSAKSDDAFSWTTDRKTAKFFADRFSRGAGKIATKKISPEEVIDYLDDRGESEVILFPKKFRSLQESLDEAIENPDNLLFRSAGTTVRFILKPDNVRALTRQPNMGMLEWFVLDKNSKFSTSTRATEQWIVEKLSEVFDSIDSREKVEKDSLMERLEVLMENPIFRKWWEESSRKYRGAIAGKRYGV